MVAVVSSAESALESPKSTKKDSSMTTSCSHKEENDGIAAEKEHDYQMYAQKLNNNAAMCIEIGYYDKATQSLQKALKFYQKQTDTSMTKMCPCDKCDIDGNIDFSADFRARAPRRLSISSIESDDGEEYVSKPKRNYSKEDIKFLTKSISNPKLEKVVREEVKKLRGEGGSDKNANWSIRDEFCEGEINEDDEELIYKRPIRVERVGHPMGGSLFLIITFNLALTHHLEVAMARSAKRNDVKSAKKALLFYELTSAHEKRLLSDSASRWDSLSSIRFNNILNSNVNQLFQYLPETSLPAARRLLMSICDQITDETERLSTGSSSRSLNSSSRSLRSRSSRSPNRWSNIDDDSSRTMPRSIGRDYSDSSTESWMSRSSKISSGRAARRASMGGAARRGSMGGTPSTIRLQNALGDMAPSPRCSRRNSMF